MARTHARPDALAAFTTSADPDRSKLLGDRPTAPSKTTTLPTVPAGKAEAVARVLRRRVLEHEHDGEAAAIVLPDRTH